MIPASSAPFLPFVALRRKRRREPLGTRKRNKKEAQEGGTRSGTRRGTRKIGRTKSKKPLVRIELTAFALQVRCSTTKLKWHKEHPLYESRSVHIRLQFDARDLAFDAGVTTRPRPQHKARTRARTAVGTRTRSPPDRAEYKAGQPTSSIPLPAGASRTPAPPPTWHLSAPHPLRPRVSDQPISPTPRPRTAL